MPEITVWTKQNIAVLEQLAADGRFIADERYIRLELENTTDIMLFTYHWLAKHAPTAYSKPSDVTFPVWVSFSREATMLPEPGYVILELSIDESLVAYIDTGKWTAITNYSYLPEDSADAAEHNRMLEGMGLNNATAVMSNFYPEVRSKIINSWDRLFGEPVDFSKKTYYGIIWEVKQEWIRQIIE